MSLSHFPPMNTPTVFSDIVDQRSFNSPIPSTPLVFLTKDNFKSSNMNLSDDNEKTTSNLDQKHPVQLTPPLPLNFDLNHPSAPEIVNQGYQLSQKWCNENQRNIKQPQQNLLQQQRQHYP